MKRDCPTQLAVASLTLVSQHSERIYTLRSEMSDLFVDQILADVFDEALTLIDRVSEVALASAYLDPRNNVVANAGAHLDTIINTTLSSTVAVASAGTAEVVGEWLQSSMSEIGAVLLEMEGGLTGASSLADPLTSLRSEVSRMAQRGYSILDQRALWAALLEARATERRRASGEQGQRDLAMYFNQYAEKELSLATWFRWASMVLIGCAVGIAGWGLFVSEDDGHIVKRALTAAAVAGFAAYLARQSGQHRRIYNWVKGLSVQLQSLTMFMDAVPDEVRADVYRDFSRRALGAPPDSRRGESDDSLSASQLLDIVTAVAKRPPTD